MKYYLLALLLFFSRESQATNYQDHVAPLIQNYCARSCHSVEISTGGVALTTYDISIGQRTTIQSWTYVLRLIEDLRMPPVYASQPTAAERELLASWEDSHFARTAEQAADISFKMEASSLEWQPFYVLRNKLSVLFEGINDKPFGQLDLYAPGLGAPNAFVGQMENRIPSTRKYQYWSTAVGEVCSHAALKRKYLGRVGYGRLILDLYSRQATKEDYEAYTEIESTVPPADQWSMICLTTLSRLEMFVQ